MSWDTIICQQSRLTRQVARLQREGIYEQMQERNFSTSSTWIDTRVGAVSILLGKLSVEVSPVDFVYVVKISGTTGTRTPTKIDRPISDILANSKVPRIPRCLTGPAVWSSQSGDVKYTNRVCLTQRHSILLPRADSKAPGQRPVPWKHWFCEADCVCFLDGQMRRRDVICRINFQFRDPLGQVFHRPVLTKDDPNETILSSFILVDTFATVLANGIPFYRHSIDVSITFLCERCNSL